MTISIITPTYNRRYILHKCYESLLAQTCQDFEWIVVDDGSIDDTEALVNEFISQHRINIKYIRQANGGKHRAHNTAVAIAIGDLTVCLDSDDRLAPNAVETAISLWQQHKHDTGLIGILALRGDLNSHQPICSRIPQGLERATMSQLRDKYGFEGDTVLFFRTDALKAHKFREFEGEKFLTELNLYCELDTLGKMLLVDQPLYYCKYLSDGLTAKYHKLLYDNPKGTADTYYRMAENATTFKNKLKYAVISQIYFSITEESHRDTVHPKSAIMKISKLLVPIFRWKISKNK